MHNPGSIPDDDRLFTGADCIVVFENSQSNFQSSTLLGLTQKAVNGYGRQNFAYVVNGGPTGNALDAFIQKAGSGAQYLFVTDLTGYNEIYEQFGNIWSSFVAGMAAG